MKIFPIIPIWLMSLLCIITLILNLKRWKQNILKILIIILLFITNLRIMIPSNKLETYNNNLEVLFVIDSTISMNALDYDDNITRLEAVKKDCNYIIEELNGASFSLITFNNSSRIITPFTIDSNITKEAIDIIEPVDELYAKGSSLNTPLETIISYLEQQKEDKEKVRIIFFISDGEITDESNLKSYKEVSKYITNGAVLGYGTKDGGYMQINDKTSGDKKYIEYYNNFKKEKAVSKIDESNLKKIANDIDVDYINMNKQSNIKNKIKEIKKLIVSNKQNSSKANYDDIYYIFLIPLLLLLLIEFGKYRRCSL